jgi:hypothetical protein
MSNNSCVSVSGEYRCYNIDLCRLLDRLSLVSGSPRIQFTESDRFNVVRQLHEALDDIQKLSTAPVSSTIGTIEQDVAQYKKEQRAAIRGLFNDALVKFAEVAADIPHLVEGDRFVRVLEVARIVGALVESIPLDTYSRSTGRIRVSRCKDPVGLEFDVRGTGVKGAWIGDSRDLV